LVPQQSDLDNKALGRVSAGRKILFDRRFESQAKREQEAREAVKGKEQSPGRRGAGLFRDPWPRTRNRPSESAVHALRTSARTAGPLDRRMRKALAISRSMPPPKARAGQSPGNARPRGGLQSKEQLDGLRYMVVANQEALAAAQNDLTHASGDEAQLLRDTIAALEESIADNNAEIDRLETSIADIESSLR